MIQTGYTIIKADGSESEHTIDWPEEPGLAHLRALLTPILDGGRLEHVLVKWRDQRTDMFVDEQFFEKNLPRNDKATDIYRSYFLSGHPGENPENLSHIRGTAILFHRRVWF